MCLMFDSNNIEHEVNGVNVVAPGDDSRSPFYVYRRGAYFDGTDDYLVLQNLIPYHSHTVWTWIRTESDGVIYSLDYQDYTELGSDDWLSFFISSGLISVKYSHGSDVKFEATSSTQVVDSDWHIVSWCMSYVDQATSVGVSIDNVQESTETYENTLFYLVDSLYSSHLAA